MKKKYLLILATTAILALSGCTNSSSNRLSADDGNNPDTPAEVSEEKVIPSDVRLDCANYSVAVGKTVALSTVVRPVAAYNAKFTYESDNPAVATVDELTGVVTGVSDGKAKITVKCVDDENIKDSAYVYVTSNLSGNNKTLAIGKMFNAQKRNYFDTDTQKYVTPDVIQTKMSYKNYISVDGKNKETFNLFRDFLSCESEAYFSMDTRSWYTNTFDAPLMYQNYRYQFLANPGRYDSFIFYTSDSRKNVYYANTGFMADEIDEQGNKLPLNEVVLRLLDSLFSTGREMATDHYDRSLQTKYLNVNKLNTAGGKVDGLLSGTYVEYTNQEFAIATDQESSYGIPAGTQFTIDLSYDLVWENGLCKRYNVHQKMSYFLDGHNYVENYDIVYSMFVNDEVEYDLPNVKDYNLVTDLYDL